VVPDNESFDPEDAFLSAEDYLAAGKARIAQINIPFTLDPRPILI